MRVFAAVEVAEASKEAVGDLVREVRPKLPRARWVRPENLHLTLAFIAKVAEERLPHLTDALARSGRTAPFRVRVAGGGVFPSSRPARVVWVGLEEEPRPRPGEPSPLARLQEAVEREVLAAAGAEPPERPFHPHLTVARCSPPWPRRATERWRERSAGLRGDPFPVESVTLFRSHLGEGGPRYEVLVRQSLEGE